MEIEKALLDFIPGVTKEILVEAIHQDPSLFDQFWELALSGKEPAGWRAAWVADAYDEKYPGRFQPYLPQLCNRVGVEKNVGVRRAILRTLTRYDIPVACKPTVIDVCFRYLWEGKTVCDKVMSMKILYRMALEQPELRKELYDSIEMQLEMDAGSKGFMGAGKKMLVALRKKDATR